MKKDFVVLAAIAILSVLVFRLAFSTFFAQDDFILINHFSGRTLWQDLSSAVGPPEVTHFRPVHNLYFLTGGNLFGKSYSWYHLLTFVFHVGAAFLIYKVAEKIFRSRNTALVAAAVYAMHPAHFVSLFWISGAATTLGFFFLIASLYTYLREKQTLSAALFIISLLASEAMAVGAFLFLLFGFLQKKKIFGVFNFKIFAVVVVFLITRLLLFTPKEAFDVYNFSFSARIVDATLYYSARIAGFAETSQDYLLTLVVLGLAGFSLVTLIFNRKTVDFVKLTVFSLIIILGLFPFVLLPDKLSPHYMNLSILGFALVVSLTFRSYQSLRLVFLLVFGIVSFFSVVLTVRNNWVLERSELARAYIGQIESKSPPNGSLLVFDDSSLSTSQEAYIALGTGEALKLWFPERNYKTCFTFSETCQTDSVVK